MDPALDLLLLFPLAALAFAAGLDLYLTLLLLGLAARTGLGGVLPGNLTDVGAGFMVAMAAGFYLLEFLAERPGPVSLFWNAVHSLIRSLGAALLFLLVVPDAPWALRLVGGGACAAIALLAHGGRFGTRQLLRLAAARPPSFTVVGLVEDAVVVVLVLLALYVPLLSGIVALAAGAAILIRGRPALRAAWFGLRLAWGVWAGLLSERQWRNPEEFPAWLRRAGTGDGLAPGGSLRGTPAAAWQIPGEGPFRIGWIVVTGGGAFFLHRRFGTVRPVPLGEARVRRVVERAVFRRVEFEEGGGRPFALLLPRDGPTTDLLRGEFRRARSTPRPGGENRVND